MSPKLVRICRMWQIFNQKNKNESLGTSFFCIDIKVCGILIIYHTKHKKQLKLLT